MMRRLALMAVCLASPALAEVLDSSSACGGDAFSSAKVIEGRPPRRGPITTVPDTLCADLEPQRRDPTRIEIYGVPGNGDASRDGETPLRDGERLGAEGGSAPYERYGRRPRP
jgi:hypothetical protein